MTHPSLGPLTRTNWGWAGTLPLPHFAEPGQTLRREDDPPAGRVSLRIWDSTGDGPSPEQAAAVARLLDREAEVFAAVWAELAGPLHYFDPHTQVICTEVEVSPVHADGFAYLGFTIDGAGHLEHGFQVVYHPTRGTFWGDGEAVLTFDGPDEE